MSPILPPASQRAVLDSAVFQRRHLSLLPDLAIPCASNERVGRRRAFLKAASVGLCLFGAHTAFAKGNQELIFSPEDTVQDTPGVFKPEAATPVEKLVQQEHLQLGEVPADFWYRPRELWIRRQGTREEVKVVYWQDGKILPEGYWQACAMLRDVKANRMTTMDPTLLDILRGVVGYYQAWRWPHPLVLTSGFRTLQTNQALSREGAAKNSMHLYGKAADMYIPGIPAKDIASLGLYLQKGGVGFYPDRGFTHLDTGRLRLWRG